jgi:hypothetical protein
MKSVISICIALLSLSSYVSAGFINGLGSGVGAGVGFAGASAIGNKLFGSSNNDKARSDDSEPRGKKKKDETCYSEEFVQQLMLQNQQLTASLMSLSGKGNNAMPAQKATVA